MFVPLPLRWPAQGRIIEYMFAISHSCTFLSVTICRTLRCRVCYVDQWLHVNAGCFLSILFLEKNREDAALMLFPLICRLAYPAAHNRKFVRARTPNRWFICIYCLRLSNIWNAICINCRIYNIISITPVHNIKYLWKAVPPHWAQRFSNILFVITGT